MVEPMMLMMRRQIAWRGCRRTTCMVVLIHFAGDERRIASDERQRRKAFYNPGNDDKLRRAEATSSEGHSCFTRPRQVEVTRRSGCEEPDAGT